MPKHPLPALRKIRFYAEYLAKLGMFFKLYRVQNVDRRI